MAKKFMTHSDYLACSYKQGSVHRAVQAFLRSAERRGLSSQSVRHLRYSLCAFGDYCLEKQTALLEVTPQFMRQYNQYLHLYYAVATITTTIGDLKQFFRWYAKVKKKNGHKYNNPALRLHKPRKCRPTRTKIVSEDSVINTLRFCALKCSTLVARNHEGLLELLKPTIDWSEEEKLVFRDLFILTLLYETGARVGELATLATRSMDNACQNNLALTYVALVFGKTAEREIKFTQKSAELYRIWKIVRPTKCEEYVFVGWRNMSRVSKLHPSTISDICAYWSKLASDCVFRGHVLRHCKVQRSRKLVGIELAKELIDHSQLETTFGYSHIENQEIVDAILKTGLQVDFWV